MIRHRERTSQSGLGSGIIVVALVIALPLLAMPRAARADIGDEPSSSGGNKPAIDQVQDTDKPREPSLLAPKPADAAVQKKAAPSEPIYNRWEFWAIAGGAVVVTILAVIAGQHLVHQMNGGDVRPCSGDFIGCYGAGQ
jgi:hypothetical protein